MNLPSIFIAQFRSKAAVTKIDERSGKTPAVSRSRLPTPPSPKKILSEYHHSQYRVAPSHKEMLSLNLDALDGVKSKRSKIPVKRRDSTKKEAVSRGKSGGEKGRQQDPEVKLLKISPWSQYYQTQRASNQQHRQEPANTNKAAVTPKKPAHR